MSASSLSLAATSTAIAAGSTSSSTSLSICNNISNLSFDHLSLTFQSKPIKIFKFKTPHYSNFTPFSRFYVSRSSAAFDDFELAQETHNAEAAETEAEQELLKKVDDGDEEGEGEAIESQSAEARRLYVGNLPYSMTSSQLADIFGEAGHVASVEVVYDRVTDRSRGFGFVTMGSVQEAKEAIRLFDGSQVGGRTVKVNFPEVPRGGERAVMAPKIRSSYQGFVDSPHKIYAGNLSWGLTSQGLKVAFEDQPGLLSAKVIYDRDSGRSRGFGFVTFSSSEDVRNALNAMNGVELEGRPLRLNVAAEQARPSSPASVQSESENRLEDGELVSSITS